MRFRSFNWFTVTAIVWLGGLLQRYSVVAQLALLQVRMGPFQSCQPSTRDAVRIFVMQQLSEGIRTMCQCNFTENHFVTPVLRCDLALNSPTFRAAVVDVMSSSGGQVVTSRDIVQHAETWAKNNPPIVSGLAQISVDSSCPISPRSFEDPPCSDSSSAITVTALVGALIIEFIILCIIGFVTFAVFVTVFTSRKKIQRNMKKQAKYAVKNPQHRHPQRSSPPRLTALPPSQSTMIPQTDVHTHPCPAYATSYISSQ